ncbi:MAG: hypothetical protein H7138_08865 [Myxococcales bacterium]|nr:hypothetical protein [Myxococcales bacterium]
MHTTLTVHPAVRLLAVAVVIVATYALLLARLERITPRSIVRGLRGEAEDTAGDRSR